MSRTWTSGSLTSGTSLLITDEQEKRGSLDELLLCLYCDNHLVTNDQRRIKTDESRSANNTNAMNVDSLIQKALLHVTFMVNLLLLICKA